MRTLLVFLTAATAALVLSGCARHPDIAGARPSPASSASTTVPSGAAPSVRESTRPGPGPTGPTPCLTSRQHFNTDADRATPQVCLRVGGVFAVATERPGRGPVTSVASSDPAVLTCGTPRPAVCQARQVGQSTVTATDEDGSWRVLVFVGR
jgi:hypothetical protein